jgi:NNP family nitrate/nitrite transporter-like MFS transporter
MANEGKAYSVLASSTLAFTVCFTIWMMFGVIGIPIKTALHLNETEFGLLTAMPVLTGSLIRVPLGIWTDRFGGRIVLFLLMLSTVIPIYLISYATAYWHFLVLGCLSVWLAVHFQSAHRMLRAGLKKNARVWQWGYSVPAIRVLPSINLLLLF